MIHGVGTDIVAIARLRRLWERHGERALPKLLALSERPDFDRAPDKGRFLAKRFAAKEAFAKALGTGIRPPATLPAIAVEHDDNGKPRFRFSQALAQALAGQGITAHLSISDEAETALAFVVMERPG